MKFLILRRIFQIGLLALYGAANWYGYDTVLKGNLSASLLLQRVPLSDPFAVLQMLAAGAALSTTVLLGAAVVFVFYAVIGGRMFCSWVCPVNMVTDAANWTRRKLGISKVQKRIYMSRNLRYWVLGLSLLLSVLTGVAAFEMISPIAMAHRGIVFGMGFGGAALLVIFLFDLFVHENGWCGHVCPLGGFYAFISRFSLIRVFHDAEKCTACMKCKEVCPEKEVLHMVARSSESVLMGACTNCGRCIDVCNDDALNFSIRKLAKKAKEMS